VREDSASADEQVMTGQGRGQFHKIDPRTGREPAGSSLLARDSAVRGAQEMAFRSAVAGVLAGRPADRARIDDERLDEFVERDLLPRVRDFIVRRWVVEESRDDRYQHVTLNVVFDTAAIRAALARFSN
jgi:hypothetical protein